MNAIAETLASRHGCTVDQIRYLQSICRQMRRAGRPNTTTPFNAFSAQRANAAWRGIAWEMTIVEWWAVWEKSGHWDERGRNGHQYVMCRRGDIGPYAVGNVFIATARHNLTNKKPKVWHEEALRLRAAGAKQCEIAARFGVSPARVSQLFSGATA